MKCPLSELEERSGSLLGKNRFDIPILLFADDVDASAKALSILKEAGYKRCVDGGDFTEVEELRLNMIESKPNLKNLVSSGGEGEWGVNGLFKGLPFLFEKSADNSELS